MGNSETEEKDLLKAGPDTRQLGYGNRDKFMLSIKKKHPDLDENGIYGYAIEKYERTKKDKDRAEEVLEKLYNAIEEEPVLSDFISTFIKYPNNISYALKRLPKEDLELALSEYDKPEDEEELNKSLSDHRKRREANKKHRENLAKNTQKSIVVIEKVAKEHGVSPDVIATALQEYVLPMFDGIYSEELIRNLIKGKSFDDTVEKVKKEAREDGFREGRNSKIEQDIMKRNNNDGLPTPPEGGDISSAGDNFWDISKSRRNKF